MTSRIKNLRSFWLSYQLAIAIVATIFFLRNQLSMMSRRKRVQISLSSLPMIKGMVTWDVMVILLSRHRTLIEWRQKDSVGQIFMLRQMFARLQEQVCSPVVMASEMGCIARQEKGAYFFLIPMEDFPPTEVTLAQAITTEWLSNRMRR